MKSMPPNHLGNLIKKNILKFGFVFLFFFLILVLGTAHFLTQIQTLSIFIKSQSIANIPASALFYKSIGRFPSLDSEVVEDQKGDRQYTLEYSTCASKLCMSNAIELLEKKGLQAFYTPTVVEGRTIYHVYLGLFPTLQEAKKSQEKLEVSEKLVTKIFKF